MTFTEKFLLELDLQIQERHLLKHPFYQAWSHGKLSQECLREYAQEYYPHVRAFPTYLSALHAHTEEPETRKELLKNLVEEEAGVPNHPELWKAFAISLGASERDVVQQAPCAEIQALIDTFRSICREGSVAEGLAALYAYESQIPAICVSKIEGLKTHYGLRDPKAWRYFTIHIAADEEHAQVERALLAKHLSENELAAVKHSTQRILDRLWDFLTAMCDRHAIAC